MVSTEGKVILAVLILVTLIHTSSSEKSFLDDYEAIPGREVDGIQHAEEINGTDAETCARICSTESRFQCLHFQHRPDEVNRPGICHIFSFRSRAYTEASHTWTIYTKNRAAFAGLPESGASSLIGGSPSVSRLLMMFAGAAAVCLVA